MLNIPSYLVRPGDIIRVKGREKSQNLAQGNRAVNSRQLPDFLSVPEGPDFEGHVMRMPEAGDVSIPVRTQLIVRALLGKLSDAQ